MKSETEATLLAVAASELAAVLAADVSGTRASHRAAAWLWDMTPYEQKPEITVVSDVRIRLKDVRVHRTTTELLEPVLRKGVPTTTAAETLLDQAGITGSHHPSVLEAKTRRLIKKAGLPCP